MTCPRPGCGGEAECDLTGFDAGLKTQYQTWPTWEDRGRQGKRRGRWYEL